MLRPLLPLFLLLSSLQAQAAQAKPLEYKSWKTFESDYGYAFKHPDCWKVEIDDPDDEGFLHESLSILVSEDSCKTRQLNPESPNGVGFGAANKIDSKEREKRITERTKGLARQTYYLVSTKWNLAQGAVMFVNVELTDKLKNAYRWNAHLYCPERVIHITGPTIKDPDKATLEKFKKGELALPEPYKTIYDSVKCTRDKK